MPTSFVPFTFYNSIQPANMDLVQYDLPGSTTIDLGWSFALQTPPYPTASTIYINCTGGSSSVKMPDATQASVGQMAYVYNTGNTAFQLKDFNGTLIVTIQGLPLDPSLPGNVKFVQLTDNSTSSGVWKVINFGTGSTSVDVAAIAGRGLTLDPNDASKLATNTPPLLIDDDIELSESLRAGTIICKTNSNITLDNDIEPGFYCYLLNTGSTGSPLVVTITPTGLQVVNDDVTPVVIPNGQGGMIVCTTDPDDPTHPIFYFWGTEINAYPVPWSVGDGGTGLSAVSAGSLVAGLNATTLQVISTDNSVAGKVLATQGTTNSPPHWITLQNQTLSQVSLVNTATAVIPAHDTPNLIPHITSNPASDAGNMIFYAENLLNSGTDPHLIVEGNLSLGFLASNALWAILPIQPIGLFLYTGTSLLVASIKEWSIINTSNYNIKPVDDVTDLIIFNFSFYFSTPLSGSTPVSAALSLYYCNESSDPQILSINPEFSNSPTQFQTPYNKTRSYCTFKTVGSAG